MVEIAEDEKKNLFLIHRDPLVGGNGDISFIAQRRGIVEGCKPKYNASLWGAESPEFALKKIKQAEDGLKEDTMLYAEVLTTLKATFKPGENIADIGCAGGHYWPVVKNALGDVSYTGLDVTRKYVDLARTKYPEKDWQVGDCRKLPFKDQSFDHTLCLFVLIHLDENGVRETMDELVRITRKQILLAGYFSFVRVLGKQREYIYDIVDTRELERPGWSIYANEDSADGKQRSMRLRIEQLNENGEWEELTGDFPIFSYVRMLKQ